MSQLLNRTAIFAATAILFFSLQTIAQPGTDVNGHNVTIVKYTQNNGGFFTTEGEGDWFEVTTNERFKFKEAGRDQWSVYLRDDGRRLSIQLDLWQKKIYLTPDGVERYVLYNISEARISDKANIANDSEKSEIVTDPPITEDKVIEEVVWEMDDNDLNAVISWVKSRVASVRVPYCYRDSYGRGAGSIPSGCANATLEKDATGGPAGLCYPKCKSNYSGVGPVCWQSCPANFRDDGAFCRKPDEYGRGEGRIPDKKPCSDWNSAYRDDGTSCWLDTYGRGAGYDFFFKDGMKNCEKDHGKGKCEMWGAIAYPKCKPGYKNVACCLCEPKGGPGIKVTAFQRYKCNSNEDLNGALCYPKCKPGYHAVGCCICSYNCPPDFGADMGVSCTKKSYGRGFGELSTCPPHLIRDETGGPAGLCFPKCKSGYHGVGPVCWMNCPPGLTPCGAGCAASDADCASTTFDQVFSVAIAAANIATMGMAKGGTVGLKAGQEAIKVGTKVFVASSKIGKYSAKALAAIQQVDEGVHTGKVIVKYVKKKLHNPGAIISETKSWTVEAYDAYKLYEEEFVNTEFINQTSTDINRELTSKLHPEYAKTVKQYYAKMALADFASKELDEWEIAEYGLLAAGMVDPTGLVDVAAAYAHPVCNTTEPFPNISANYLK